MNHQSAGQATVSVPD
jgi:hypothetical protein